MKFKNISIYHLVSKCFVDNNIITHVSSFYLKKGIADYPTWFVHLNCAHMKPQLIVISKRIDLSGIYQSDDINFLTNLILNSNDIGEDLINKTKSHQRIKFTPSIGFKLIKYLKSMGVKLSY